MKKTEFIHIRLSVLEKAKALKKAEAQEKSISEWVRDLIRRELT